jgi:quercetin dioxygenase-like cupin family protein
MATVARHADLPRLVPTKEGDHRFRVELVTREMIGDGDLVGLKLTYSPGDSVPNHYHPNSRHVLFVLDGNGVLHGEDGDTDLSPGDVAIINKGEPHFFSNESAEPWTFIELSMPAPPETVWLVPDYSPEWVAAGDTER